MDSRGLVVACETKTGFPILEVVLLESRLLPSDAFLFAIIFFAEPVETPLVWGLVTPFSGELALELFDFLGDFSGVDTSDLRFPVDATNQMPINGFNFHTTDSSTARA